MAPRPTEGLVHAHASPTLATPVTTGVPLLHPRHDAPLEVGRHLGLMDESFKGFFECRIMRDFVMLWFMSSHKPINSSFA